MSTSSRIFVPNRALGFVSNHVPLVTRYIDRRRESVVVTCVGRHFHTYGTIHFTLLNVSGQHPDDVTALAADKSLVYTAAQNEVYAWRMGTQLKHTYTGHTSPVHLLLPFGPHLISVDEGSCLKVWDTWAAELYTEINFEPDTFEVTALVHPATYVNKILVGSRQGQMQLWNLHTRKLIFTFAGWGSAVTVLEQAPAIDVVAVGLADGRVVVHNLKFDETIVDFSQDWGQVTSISFRSDGPPMMYTGTGAGHIISWDLEKKENVGQLWNAHYGPVTGLQCLPSEPLMVSSSPDNSLKMWIFDMPDGGGRLLKVREGHALPPTTIKFHRRDQILAAGADSTLRVFSTVTETKNHSYGRAVFNKKMFKKIKNKRSPDAPLVMPPIVRLSSEPAREKEWDNLVALHRGLAEVTTWSSDKGCMGEHRLLHNRFKEQPSLKSAVATSVSLTQCGNFVLIGMSTGHLDRFNMQSGLHRCEYQLPKGKPAHEGAVRGIVADPLNQLVVSGGADEYVRFWNFREGKTIGRLQMSSSVAFFANNKDSSLLGVALDNNSVCVVDMDSRGVIRRLPNHLSRLTNVEFSQDARWLFTATMDCKVCTWDIPSANLIDIFKVPAPVTSMTLNSTGEMLATTHVNFLGVYLWANKAIHMHLSLRPLDPDVEAEFIDLPSQEAREVELGVELEQMDLDEVEFKSPEQISLDLVTLSTLSTSRWLNVLDLDIIKRRNKPKEAPQAPKAAPFFLPTIPALEFKFDLRPSLDEQMKSSQKIIPDRANLAKLLAEGVPEVEPVVQFLKTLGPSGLDAEILSLAPEGGGSVEILGHFADFVGRLMEDKRDFELAQTYFALFLKHHGDQCIADPVLSEKLVQVQLSQDKSWTKIEHQMLYCLSVVQALKGL